MSAETLLREPPCAAPPATGDDVTEMIASVFSLLTGGPVDRASLERRRHQRYPYPHPIKLTPINEAGEPLEDETFHIVGRRLSAGGLDFFHHEPVPYRRVIATLGHGDLPRVQLLLDLTWCRFVGHGWYDNGGRFLGQVRSEA